MTNSRKRPKYILGIDTAVLSGSIALCTGRKVLCSIDSGVSRSEDLMNEIGRVLEVSELRTFALDSIAVSVGPGSFTGIRIGIATALGLAKSISADCFGVPVLDAISAEPTCAGRIPILPLGRRQYIVAGNASETNVGSNSYTNKYEILDESLLIERIATCTGEMYLFPKLGSKENGDTFSKFRELPNVSFCDSSIAELLCKRVFSGDLVQTVSPIYAQR